MLTIEKHNLNTSLEIQSIKIAQDAVILSVGLDTATNLSVWVLADDQSPVSPVAISIIGSSLQVPTAQLNRTSISALKKAYLGTVTKNVSTWHVFAVR